MGYDAYTVPAGLSSGGADDATGEPGQVVVLNRGKMVIQERFKSPNWRERVENAEMPEEDRQRLLANEPPDEPPLPEQLKPAYPGYHPDDEAYEEDDDDDEA